MARLAVNVDHVANIRQARGIDIPDPVTAAALVELAGAHGIVVHLREDRRHIQDRDVRILRETVKTKLNLEMATTGEMVRLACELAPDQVSVVPERDNEVTTEGGLDVVANCGDLETAARPMVDAGVEVSVFLDPDEEQIRRLAGMPRELIGGFEINTDRYSQARAADLEDELRRIVRCAELGASLGLHVYAGHSLTTANVGPLAAVPEIEEFNIGHSIVARSVFVGIREAVREMKRLVTQG